MSVDTAQWIAIVVLALLVIVPLIRAR